MGIPVGVAILAVISYLFWRRRRGVLSRNRVEGRDVGNTTGHGVDGKPELDGK